MPGEPEHQRRLAHPGPGCHGDEVPGLHAPDHLGEVGQPGAGPAFPRPVNRQVVDRVNALLREVAHVHRHGRFGLPGVGERAHRGSLVLVLVGHSGFPCFCRASVFASSARAWARVSSDAVGMPSRRVGR